LKFVKILAAEAGILFFYRKKSGNASPCLKEPLGRESFFFRQKWDAAVNKNDSRKGVAVMQLTAYGFIT
jgi:hypothetical protein